jgi:hypothetical protein
MYILRLKEKKCLLKQRYRRSLQIIVLRTLARL